MPLHCETKYITVVGSDGTRCSLPAWHVPEPDYHCQHDVKKDLRRGVERMQEMGIWPSDGYDQLVRLGFGYDLIPEGIECLSTSTSV